MLAFFVVIAGSAFYNVTYKSEPTPVEETKDVKMSFIETIAPTAERLDRQYQVPASIIMAQAILESNFGQSELGAKYHNLFGVKAAPNEPSVSLETKEYTNGEWQTIYAHFKVYKSWEESLTDHTKLMVNGTTWNANQYNAVVNAKTYQEAAQALQSAGYATDPAYAQKLIRVIQMYHLDRYDQTR